MSRIRKILCKHDYKQVYDLTDIVEKIGVYHTMCLIDWSEILYGCEKCWDIKIVKTK